MVDHGASSDEDDYVFYGTALQDEAETWSGSRRKPVVDAGAARALPVWKQEVTDEEGRRRLHGAFTGGFSAGYYNTVGSAIGFEPSTFKSSRSDRNKFEQQGLEAFLDEDELEERRKGGLAVRSEYDTFGAAASEAARAQAAREADLSRPSIIPGALMEELVGKPVADGMGIRLLHCMGWRAGRGTRLLHCMWWRAGRGIDTASSSGGQTAGSKWGTVSGVSLENTPIYVLQPKLDLHGLGFDPFQDAEEFRQYRQDKLSLSNGGGRGGAGSAEDKGKRRGPGLAFGTGVLDETDTLGYMDDYVDHAHEGPARQGFALLPGSRALELAGQGFNFELALSDEEEEEDRGRSMRNKDPLRLEGSTQRPMLQTAEQLRRGGDFIPGFVKSEQLVEFKYYTPPEVPASFTERHTFPMSHSNAAVRSGQPGLPPPPQFPAPHDPTLCLDIETLAALRLTVEQRLALLGEVPLPPKRTTPSTALPPGGPAPPGGPPSSAGGAAKAPIAEGDKRMLHSQLSSGFVRGETQDMSHGKGGVEPGSALVGGLRPGVGGAGQGARPRRL
eukprot:gene6638-3295_t